MKAIRSSETSVMRTTQRNIPEDGILQIRRSIKIPSSGILRRVALVRTDASVECIAGLIRVTRTGELRMLAVTCNRLVTANVLPSSPIFATLTMEGELHSF
jgi:hypothetical protein